MGDNPSKFQGNPRQPVEQVSWDDVQPFLAKLNESRKRHEGKFALPTEAQWEYACRAGTTTFWHDGDGEESLRESGWFHANHDGNTQPVGRLAANAWRLHDMHGNVWEWCADWFAADYYRQSPTIDPTGPPAGSHRVLRGGSWSARADCCGSAFRLNHSPDKRYDDLGLRLVCELDH
jgi:formylglycine-generating enzyme required for sulfatase activity